MRKKCISEETFMDYLEDRLSDKKRSEIEQHLTECDTCLEELIVAKKMMQEEDLMDLHQSEWGPVPENVTRQAIERVKALKKDSLFKRFSGLVNRLFFHYSTKCTDLLWYLFPLRTPATATVRGKKKGIEEDHLCIKKSFQDFEVEIEFEKQTQEQSLIKVRLVKNNMPTKPIRATLMRNKREVSSCLINDSSALFEDIPFGHYVLIFTQKGNQIGDYPFEIKEHMGR